MFHSIYKAYVYALLFLSCAFMCIPFTRVHATITITPTPNPIIDMIWHSPANTPYTNNVLQVNYTVESPLRLSEWSCVSMYNGGGSTGGWWGWTWTPSPPPPPGPRNAKGRTKY